MKILKHYTKHSELLNTKLPNNDRVKNWARKEKEQEKKNGISTLLRETNGALYRNIGLVVGVEIIQTSIVDQELPSKAQMTLDIVHRWPTSFSKS